MKNKIYLLTIFILCSTAIFAQVAIVSDKDGYVNVRDLPEIKQDNIIDTLHNGSFVYVMDEEIEGNWVNVDFRGLGNKHNIFDGYIYANRIKYISDYQNIPKVSEKENKLILKGDNISIEVKIRKFDSTKHIITYATENKWVYVDKIDGKGDFWGTDGNMPKYEYEYIRITINGSTYSLPKDAIKNLFEPNLGEKVNYDKENDILYIQSINSDGAGAYVVVWKIEKGIYKERAVFYGF